MSNSAVVVGNVECDKVSGKLTHQIEASGVIENQSERAFKTAPVIVDLLSLGSHP
jgi:hypothetical protein